MANVHQKINGTTESTFQLNNTGPILKDNSDVLEARNAADSDYELIRGDHVPNSGQTDNDIPSLRDLKGKAADIVYSFAGASAPSAGSNTNEFGFCHTTGGSWTAGQVVFDTGAALVLQANSEFIITRSAVSGTISLDANSLYMNQAGTWTKKAASTSGANAVNVIRVAFAYTDGNVDSTASISNGDQVVETRQVMTAAFSGGTTPTIACTVNGGSPETLITAGDFDPEEARDYQTSETHAITAGSAGVVRVAVTPDGSSAGAGYVLVSYVTPAS